MNHNNHHSKQNIKDKKAAEKPEKDEHSIVELSVQRYSIFSQQNVKAGHFDVTFQFKDKKVHAHSFVLWSASDVFEAMLLGPMAKKEPIPITAHSYEDFKEFITFFYLGKCSITMENVMALVDLAESYNVQLLKDKCDHYLTNVTPTAENVFKTCEPLKIYSLQSALDNMYEFIANNATTLLKSQSFLNTTKDVLLDIVKMERLVIKEEELFDAVYKWAEFQHQKQIAEVPTSIKDLLTDILPHIRFPVMDIEYLHSHVVPHGDLFSSFNELSQILKDAGSFQKKTLTQPASKYPHTMRKSYNIEIKDNNGNVARAYIIDKNFIERLVKLVKQNQILRSYDASNNDYYYEKGIKECYWTIEISKPATINKSLMDLNACKFYIVRNQQGMFALKDFSPPAENVPTQGYNEQLPAAIYGMLQQHIRNQNHIRNNQNHTDECDVIARVYPENNNFMIAQGCVLKVVSENGNSSNVNDFRNFNPRNPYEFENY